MSGCDPNAPSRRQEDMEPLYAENGAIYLLKRELLLSRKTWYNERCFGYLMPDERSVDVDSPFDWKVADLILQDAQMGKDGSGRMKAEEVRTA